MNASEEFYEMLTRGLTESERKAQMTGFVYFIYNESNGYTKVGRTKNMKARFNQLSSSTGDNLVLIYHELVADAKNTERNLHNLYKDYKIKGEWYDVKKYMIDNSHTYLKETEGQIKDIARINLIQNNASGYTECHDESVKASALVYDGTKPKELQC